MNENKAKKSGLTIRALPRDGDLFASGLRPRDRVVAVGGHEIGDELDFYYHAAQNFLTIEIERGGRVGEVEVERTPGTALEADFYENPVDRCANRCVFCFIDQMPPNLRRSLYIKDEDVKHSFLNGNYVTLTSMTQEDLRRVVSIGLSPLFVSVHATDPKVRAMMLGNKRIPDIREQLAYLSGSGIAFHTQIVLCPGYNDGAMLERTVNDLFAYKNSLLSIAVVPVGLTRFRKKLAPLTPVDERAALDVCVKMEEVSARMAARDGVRKLFVADEFFIKAGLPIPPAKYYEDYPQIENGVGLVRQLMVEGGKVRRLLTLKSKKSNSLYEDGGYPRNAPPKTDYPKSDMLKPNYGGKIFHEEKFLILKDVLVVTGFSAYPYIKDILTGIGSLVNINYDVIVAENYYMGETVTVVGLLTARDVIRKIKESSSDKLYSEVILPAVMFNHAGYTLDGYSPNRIARAVGLPIRVAASMYDVVGC